jgi:hypothetical protein
VHVGDAYSVLAGLADTITVVNVAIANAAGVPTSWIDVPAEGLPVLRMAYVAYVASGTDEFERVPPGMWGLFSGPDGTGKLLAVFGGNATGLQNGVGSRARSVVNATSWTLEVFSVSSRQARAGAGPRQVVYPATAANLDGTVSSATLLTQVPDDTYCLYEHPGQAGKQWIFRSDTGPVDLTLPSIGAAQLVSSVLNKTTRTVELRADEADGGTEQLVRPGQAVDLVPALNDKARFATLLDRPGEGQYSLTTSGGEQGVFSRSVMDLLAELGPERIVTSAANQTAYTLALFPQPGFMAGPDGIQPVASRSAASVRDPVAGGVGSAEIRPLGSVAVWGDPADGLTDAPVGLTDVFAAAAGTWHWLVVRADGTVTAWGSNNYGQCSVPAGLRGVVAVAAGMWHSLALLADGTVTGWGDNSDRQINVPAGLSAVAIAAAGTHSLALRADGTVVAWGFQTRAGELLAPPAGLSDVVAIATSQGHCLAARADGTVTAWGANYYGETVVPPGLSDVIAVAAGMFYSLALRADGTVAAWGYQTGEGELNQVPTGLSDVVAIATSTAVSEANPWIHDPGAGAGPVPDTVVAAATGAMRSLALRADGTIVTWGTRTGSGEAFASPAITAARSVAMAAGEAYSLAICITK